MKLNIFYSMPGDDVLKGILQLHRNIFGDSEDLVGKMKSKPQLLVQAAMDGEKVIEEAFFNTPNVFAFVECFYVSMETV
ncbi:hypothetical protein LLY41_19600 [Cytobacillus firmus]|uniref:hypothetical protein n=1 Tax=Cytobacillus firmus TaxID=1399 RepID=UPI00218B8E89|nr:hypothetical protein [Cytobacillus firmus]URM32524.1 hypothetical protein LLY41_19600 [Cytobacillus firmus]